MSSSEAPPSSKSVHNRLVLSIDMGTTYTAVSYAVIPAGVPSEDISEAQIRTIRNYPSDWNFDPGDAMKMEVPTEYMYPRGYGLRRRVSDRDVEMRDGEDFEDPDEPIWGYHVHGRWALPETHEDKGNQAVSRIKLLLDNSRATTAVRRQVNGTMSRLKRRGVIRSHFQVISDFLTCLLRHVEAELQREGIDNSYETEIVLCIPPMWTQKALRTMQTCLAVAIDQAKFREINVANNAIDNLFIVSEPEAAATWMLTLKEAIKSGEAFVLLDAGGGTVDASTYEVTTEYPLRLKSVKAKPGGALCGSSYINQDVGAYLREILSTETYLENGSETIATRVEQILMDFFEYRVKRSFDIDSPARIPPIAVPGLRKDPAKGFRDGSIVIGRNVITNIFTKRFDQIVQLMKDQLGEVDKDESVRITKVVLIGGFAASISLQKYLGRKLEEYNRIRGKGIRLLCPEDMAANTVSCGAVLRALNKNNGPSRISQSSYAILRHEPWGEYEEHRHSQPNYSKVDGKPYLWDALKWVMLQGEFVGPKWRSESYRGFHVISADSTEPFVCNEQLYVSDRPNRRSHYKLRDKRNNGSEKVGDIEIDFSELRDRGLLEVIDPLAKEEGKVMGKPHYRVDYELIIWVVGRSLDIEVVVHGGMTEMCRIKPKCRLNIASSFPLGTA